MDAVPQRSAINTSASHVFRVLRFVAECNEPLGVTEIGRRLALPVSTVFRALVTLEESGYIQRHHNAPRFEIGTMPHLLKRALYNRFPLHSASRKHLRMLAEQTGETVSLSMRLGWYMVRIAGAFGSHDIYHRSRLGETMLLHESAEGRIVLALLSAAERVAFVQFVATHHPAHAPAAWQNIDEQLAADAARGYAVRALPEAPGFVAVALPIRDAGGGASASILVDGPVLQENETQLDAAIVATRVQLEALVAANPERFRSPFWHIPVDAIRMRLADTSGVAQSTPAT
ncbi:MAG: helix-turn-helix domain-containing protein [Rhodospirillales bacterium]